MTNQEIPVSVMTDSYRRLLPFQVKIQFLELKGGDSSADWESKRL
jgi:hypothetical protein